MDSREIFHCCRGIKDGTEVSVLLPFAALRVLVPIVHMSVYRLHLPSPDGGHRRNVTHNYGFIVLPLPGASC